MTIRNSVVTVGLAEVTAFDPAYAGAAGAPCKVLLVPDSANTGTIYVGATGVTADAAATGGVPLGSTGLAVDVFAGEVIKAIATGASQKLRVFAAGA